MPNGATILQERLRLREIALSRWGNEGGATSRVSRNKRIGKPEGAARDDLDEPRSITPQAAI